MAVKSVVDKECFGSPFLGHVKHTSKGQEDRVGEVMRFIMNSRRCDLKVSTG